jgi:HEPN domain-containing protein
MNRVNRKENIILRWLDKADEDLAAGIHLLKEGSSFLNVVASQAQQAAEKFIKGYLTWRQKDFPKTHNLEILVELVAEVDPQTATELKEVITLTDFVITARYPEDLLAISLPQAQEAITLAQKAAEIVLSALPAEIILRRRKT